MDKVMREFGKSLQKELISKLITASEDATFDKDTFFTEENLVKIFDNGCVEMKKSAKKAAKKKAPTAPKKAKKKPAKKKQEPEVSTSDIDDIVDELDELVEEYESNQIIYSNKNQGARKQ